MKDMKESNPIQLEEYAVLQGINNEPVFAWWSNHILKNMNKLLARLKLGSK